MTAEEDLVAHLTMMTVAQDQAMTQLLNSARGILSVHLHDFLGWYTPIDVENVFKLIVFLLRPMEQAVAALVDGWTASSISIMTGRVFQPIGTRRTEIGRTNITPEGALARAADTYRYQQSVIDKTFSDSVHSGEPMPPLQLPYDAAMQRATGTVDSNFKLAMRKQSQATLSRAADRNLITGYRRVIHPELAHEGTCGLCIAASTRIYHSDHLMAVHPGCHCTPLAIRKMKSGQIIDPGAAINDQDLSSYYRDAQGNTAEQLRQTRYKVDEHGELGPVLRPVGQPIRSEEQAKRDAKQPRRIPKSAAEKLKTMQNKHDLLVKDLHDYQASDDPDPYWINTMWERVGSLEREIQAAGG